jgi:N4-bis(aminopropyl)spermidine synthase
MFGEYVRQLMEHSTNEIDAICRVLQHRERPPAKRAWDQIYMLAGSQLTQAKLISDYIGGKRIAFIGDGDCMALSIAYLSHLGMISRPEKIFLFDFDESLLGFVKKNIEGFGWSSDHFVCETYNVMDPLPDKYKERAEVFYTNPPYGYSSNGKSGNIFLSRCMDAIQPNNSRGVAILPYDFAHDESSLAMQSTQTFISEHGFVVSEMLRGLHQYDLDDRPLLFSCTVILDRIKYVASPYYNSTVPIVDQKNFYGKSTVKIPKFIDLNGSPVYDE